MNCSFADYLGDGVYAKFDGCGIELRANDLNSPTDRIYLEPEVFSALCRFWNSALAAKKELVHANEKKPETQKEG